MCAPADHAADHALEALAERAAGRRPARVFVLTAPAGSGKDTVLDALRRRNLGLQFILTSTTRSLRPDKEQPGVNYRFLTAAEFERLCQEGEFLEHAEYDRHRYGTPRQPVRQALARGQDVLLKIEVQGAAAIKRLIPQAVLIFLTAPDLAELERRLRERGTDDEASIQRRLARAREELARIPEYDYLVINYRDGVEAAVDELVHIVKAERARLNVAAVQL